MVDDAAATFPDKNERETCLDKFIEFCACKHFLEKIPRERDMSESSAVAIMSDSINPI